MLYRELLNFNELFWAIGHRIITMENFKRAKFELIAEI